LFFAAMSPGVNRVDDFDVAYEAHLEHLTAVPGVGTAVRAWEHQGGVVIGGEVKELPSTPGPQHLAAYTIDDPAVLLSDEWRRAVDVGEWSSVSRAGTVARDHRLFRVASVWSGGARTA
jgi:hypothetical protein